MLQTRDQKTPRRRQRQLWLARAGGCAAALCLAGAASAQVAAPAPVEQTTLARDAFATGVLNRAQGALPADLWRGAEPDTLAMLLDRAPDRPAGPALGETLRRVLLTAGDAPEGATPSLGGRKLLALARAGFTEEARTVASLSSAPRNDPHVGQALAVADLLDGAPDEACRRNANLSEGRDGLFWVKLRVLCYAIAEEPDAADLTLGLLQDQGALSETDAAFLTPLATGAAPKTPPAPEDALHLAALRALDLPLSPALLGAADAGVLKAAAGDATVDIAVRVAAAQRAAAMGVMSAGELAAVYRGAETDVADLAGAGALARERADDPMTDVILYLSVAQMSAPEFLRDKASRIALALATADDFPRAYAASKLYAEDIAALEGALVAPQEARRFALARMIAGDADGAARWLFAMLGDGGVDMLDEEDAMAFIDLAGLLGVLDPVAAELLAERAGVDLADPLARLEGSEGGGGDPGAMAAIVEAAFEAAVSDIPGQAALAALAASDAAPPGDPLAKVVIGQSLRAAGLADLRRRMEFEAALKARFAATALAGGAGRGDAGGRDESAALQSDGFAPSVKPRGEP